jgi:hypothetical protein
VSLADRAAGWWSAWKWVLLLVCLLALSAWLNVKQYGWRAEAKAEARAETLNDVLATISGIARDAQGDNAGLLKELGQIVDRGRKTRIVYGKAAAEQPLGAGCAPGQGRIDAVNQTLGPSKDPP